jgi:hypothetical protein
VISLFRILEVAVGPSVTDRLSTLPDASNECPLFVTPVMVRV